MSNEIGPFVDPSGYVAVGLFDRTADRPQEQFTDFEAPVPEDWLAVRGGVEGTAQPYGALLTASHPNDNMTSWLGSAKAHKYNNPFRIRVWAIGMKVRGLSREQLRRSIELVAATSAAGLTPEAVAHAPSGYVLMSGGFRVAYSGAGSLATASYPESIRAWRSRSKAHLIPDQTTITSIGVAIKQDLIPNLLVQVSSSSSLSASSETPALAAALPPGFVMTGGGAQVHTTPQAAGNLLWGMTPRMHPTFHEFVVNSKAHGVSSPAQVEGYVLGIRLSR